LLKKALDTFWDSGWVIPKQATMHTYGVLIKSYGQIQSLTEAWQLWSEVTEEKGMEPSEQLYGQMLDLLVGNNRLEDALNLFQQMKATHKANLNTQGFAVAYAMIIRGFAQQKDCTRALQCYDEMKGHGTKASLVVLNTLIDACSRVGDMQAASRLFQDMEESQCVPDLITYSTMIKGYCISEDLEKALQVFGEMQEKGIRPDAIVFNSLLDGCAKKQVPALCEQVISDMEAAGVLPSNHSASILIKLYGRCKDLGAAFRVIDEMPQKYGFRANNAVYTCLMSACIVNGHLDRAMELRVRMVKDGIYPDDRTYSTLLRGTLRACSVEQCALLVNAAIDQNAYKVRNLLEEDLVRSVLVLMQRHNMWDTHGRDLSERLRSGGMNVRLPLPSDPCNRNDGFGQAQRDNTDGKRNFGNYRDQAASKDGRYQQAHHQRQYQQQRRY
jgi:pentatricopeptide repeat protein